MLSKEKCVFVQRDIRVVNLPQITVSVYLRSDTCVICIGDVKNDRYMILT